MKKLKYLNISKTKKLRFLDNYYKKKLYIVFLPGFQSDVTGEKPKSFQRYAIKKKVGFLALEYSGHGKSSGKFTSGNISKWSHEVKIVIKKINFLETKPICVVFADQEFDLSLIQKIIDIGYKGVMIDTFNKNGKSSLDLLNRNDIKKFTGIVKKNNLICGFSGSLKLHHIAELKNLDIDFLGFRGQLCMDSKDRDSINMDQVNRVSHEIKS